jgi:hypothetical protein
MTTPRAVWTSSSSRIAHEAALRVRSHISLPGASTIAAAMFGRLKHRWRERRARRLEQAAADPEGIRQGREVWEENRYGERQSGVRGSGRRTTFDEGHTRDQW